MNHSIVYLKLIMGQNHYTSVIILKSTSNSILLLGKKKKSKRWPKRETCVSKSQRSGGVGVFGSSQSMAHPWAWPGSCWDCVLSQVNPAPVEAPHERPDLVFMVLVLRPLTLQHHNPKAAHSHIHCVCVLGGWHPGWGSHCLPCSGSQRTSVTLFDVAKEIKKKIKTTGSSEVLGMTVQHRLPGRWGLSQGWAGWWEPRLGERVSGERGQEDSKPCDKGQKCDKGMPLLFGESAWCPKRHFSFKKIFIYLHLAGLPWWFN